MDIKYYKSLIFILIKPPSKIISYHQIKNRNEHIKLLETASIKQYIVYHSEVEKIDGQCVATQPWIIDRESINNYKKSLKVIDDNPKNSTKNSTKDDSDIYCPFCDKQMSTMSGRTLHIKSKHADKFKEYFKQKG